MRRDSDQFIAIDEPASSMAAPTAADGGDASRAIHLLGSFSDSIIENVNVWLNVLDTQYNIVLWNKVAERISGFMRSEVIGHNKIWEWLYPDARYRDLITAKTATLFARDETIEYFETKIRCKNGETRFISWNSRSLLNDGGEVCGAITFGYDITDRKNAEEALQKAHSEMSALYHVTAVASASLDLDTILERSLECVLATMKSNKGTIHLWDETEETLRLVAQQGLGGEAPAHDDPLGPSYALVNRVFEQGMPLTTPDVSHDALLGEGVVPEPPQAYLGVPMRAKGRAVGVFSVFGEAGCQFSAEEIALLVSIAEQVAVAAEHARLYQQAEQLAVMEERERLAQDLHDSVTQSLYSLTLFAEAGRRLIKAGDPKHAEDYVVRLGETAQDALREMRLIVYRLSPPLLEREGLVGAIQHRLGAVERRAGVKAHLLANDMIKLSGPVEEGLYRIAQEALNNALKHARASSVTVRIGMVGECVELEIHDNGSGFDVDCLEHQSGVGLTSMQERARKLGGVLSVTSGPAQGTTVACRIRVCTGDRAGTAADAAVRPAPS